MAVVGFQDFWLMGSRFWFQREQTGANPNPWTDLGLISTIEPTAEIEQVTLEDPFGGVLREVDVAVRRQTETYALTTRNMSLRNWANFLFANDPSTLADYVQAAGEKRALIYAHPGELAKLHDTDAAKTNLFNYSHIIAVLSAAPGAGVLTETPDIVTAINATTKTITYSGADLTSEFDPGDAIVIPNAGTTEMADPLNCRTYTVASASPNSIVVNETPNSTEAARLNNIIYKADAGNTGTVYKPTVDWKEYFITEGFLQMVPGGPNFIAAADVYVITQLNAIATGKRLIRPQSFKGQVKGNGLIVMSRANTGGKSTVREATVAIIPQSSSLAPDEYASLVFQARVLSEITETDAGRMIDYLGAAVPLS